MRVKGAEKMGDGNGMLKKGDGRWVVKGIGRGRKKSVLKGRRVE